MKDYSMFSRKLTFILIPDSQGVSKQISVYAWLLWAGVISLSVLLLAVFFFASSFVDHHVDKSEMARLEAENKQLADKFENLRWSLAEANSRWGELVQKEIAVRTIFDLPEISLDERQLGVGGPEPPSLAAMSQTQLLAYNTEAEVDHLLRLSRFELQKYNEVEKSLTDLKDRLDHTPSIMPARGWFSSGYGNRNDPFTGRRQFHRGIDIANHPGTPVIAPADGRVKKYGTYGNMGKMLVIDHGYGFVTRYGHLGEIKVKRGQQIKRGDVIATIGNSGKSTGPHLHYEVWRNGKVMNPNKFIIKNI
ncbi:MAG: hypothetical protein DRP45_09695 [Candidatus Zixiibacteriota bacterium]|nr:MAG: hypothetical protein DRP45_09695 [candidate division Zixibacteria bacterium]